MGSGRRPSPVAASGLRLPSKRAPEQTAIGTAVAPIASAEAARGASVRTGRLGEWLNGDTYSFRADSVHVCGPDPNEARPQTPHGKTGKAVRPKFAVMGVEVELKALHSRILISPRDIQLRSGDVVFNAGLDFERQLPGCLPVLIRSMLPAGDDVRGFVLFNVPLPEPPLTLSYQPTRWGGATRVEMMLPCVSCVH